VLRSGIPWKMLPNVCGAEDASQIRELLEEMFGEAQGFWEVSVIGGHCNRTWKVTLKQTTGSTVSFVVDARPDEINRVLRHFYLSSEIQA
jgi:selenophosphate synthetase-related protein